MFLTHDMREPGDARFAMAWQLPDDVCEGFCGMPSAALLAILRYDRRKATRAIR